MRSFSAGEETASIGRGDGSRDIRGGHGTRAARSPPSFGSLPGELLRQAHPVAIDLLVEAAVVAAVVATERRIGAGSWPLAGGIRRPEIDEAHQDVEAV